MRSHAAPAGVGDDRVRRGRVVRVRNAALWKTPRSVLTVILSVEALCVTWLVIANVYETVTLPDIGRFILLFVVAVAYTEGGDRIEALRRFAGYVENSVIGNAASLWCFAAALVLPTGLTGVFAALIYAHILYRATRRKSAQPYRILYTATTEVFAAMAASSVLAVVSGSGAHAGESLGTSVFSALGIVAALFTYTVVNQTLIAVVVYLVVRPKTVRSILMTGEDQILEVATLALAVLFAVAVVHAPYVAPFTLPLIIVLRRSALVRELQIQATRDAKTGLLNAGAWRQEAERQLVRSERIGGEMSVLMIDLDHFKQLNDSYGHQAGDATLRVVADCITDALRGYDAVGRFGGEEFIALLADADGAVSYTVAERLCSRIRALQLPHGDKITASIGVGVGIAGDHGLDDMIAVADRALYIAKGSGRDQVYAANATQPGEQAPAVPVIAVSPAPERRHPH